MTLDEIKEYVAEYNPDALVFDDFCDAFIGVSDDGSTHRAVYDYNKMVRSLVENDKMTEEEAIDYISYNTIRSLPYYGDSAPIVLYPVEQ